MLLSRLNPAATKLLQENTFEAYIVATIRCERTQDTLGHAFNMPNILGRLLQNNGEERVNCLLYINLPPHVEYLFDEAQ